MICFMIIESDIIIDQVETSIHDFSINDMFHCTFCVEVTAQRQRHIFIHRHQGAYISYIQAP